MRKGTLAIYCLSYVSGLALATPVHAQTASTKTAAPSPTTGKGDSDAADITDIVVTATRREERLQKVPISITAIGGPQLARSGITQTNDLTLVTPGLNFSRFNALFQPQIRGVGSRTANVGDESSVAIYIDGIYQPESAAGSFDLLKVSRVEILRGPQGTLFGRNATGGLINVITPDPEFVTSGEVTVRLGNFGEQSGKLYATTGLGDKFAADLAASVYRDTGFVHDIVRNQTIGQRKSVTLRSKLLFQASDKTSFVLIANYLSTHDNSAAAFTPLDNNTRGRVVSPGLLLPSGPFETALSIVPVINIRQWGLALRGKFELGDVDLETTTSYQDNRLLSATDGDASPANISLLKIVQTDRALSQEIRAVGESGRLKWITGVYGFYANAGYQPIRSYSYPGGTERISSLTNKNYTSSGAVFAEGTYALTDNLNLIGGVRYTYEHRRFKAGPTGTVITDADTHNQRVTPRAIIQYNITKSTNVYASYSTGFKSGVFNTSGTSPVPVNPETITSYEVGVKTDVFRWLRVNLSAFHYEYSNLQVSIRDPIAGVSLLQNAADARLSGGEAEITAKLSRSLDLRGTFSYLDTRFTNFANALVTIPTGAGGNNQVNRDVSGNSLTRAPKTTFGLNGDYHHDLWGGEIHASANLFHSSKYYWDVLNRLTQHSYTQVNAELGFEFGSGWGATVSASNLLNKTIEANVVSTVNADYASYEAPRRYGLTISKRF